MIVLLANDLYENPFPTVAIELVIKDVLPRSKVQFAVSDRDDHFTAHDLPLVMCIGVVFASAIVMVSIRGWIERGEFFQPLVVVVVQPGFVVVYEHAGCNVHRVTHTCLGYFWSHINLRCPQSHALDDQRTEYHKSCDMFTKKC